MADAPDLSATLPLDFQEAIEWAGKRGVQLPDAYYGSRIGLARARAFTCSDMASIDQIQEVLDSLNKALKRGGTFGDWQKIAGLKGHTKEFLALTPARRELIFRNFIQNAYQGGRWSQQKDNKFRPFLMYDAVNDARTRPNHRAMDGIVRPVGDPFWKKNYPSNGHGCRCSAISLTEKQAIARGGVNKPIPPEAIPDPGWDYNPGEAWDDELKALEAAKAKDLPPTAKSIYHQKVEVQKQATHEATQAALKALAEEKAKVEAEKIAFENAQAAQWKFEESQAGNLGKWYLAAAKQMGQPPPFHGDLDKLADFLHQKSNQANYVSKYKAAMIAGKVPGKAFQEAFDALTPAEQGAVQAKIDEALAQQAAAKALQAAQEAAEAEALALAKAQAELDAKAALDAAQAKAGAEAEAATAATREATLDTSAWDQIGPQAGSNPGGMYVSPEGDKWYIKFPGDEAQAHNEVLTGKLYALAGIDVPELRIVTSKGKVGIASKFVDGLKKDAAAIKAGKVEGVKEGFAADAWLANWDVVGTSFDNLLVKDGKAVRVDTGGGLLFRAQGTPKGAAFGDDVVELETLLDPSTNPNTAAVFGKIAGPELKASVARVLAIPEGEIRKAVISHGAGTLAEREALADRLVARQGFLALKFPDVPPAIREARKSAEYLLASEFKQSLADLDNDILLAIKGIANRASKGLPLEQKDLDRVAGVLTRYSGMLGKAGAVDVATLAKVGDHYQEWVDRLSQAVEGKSAGSAAEWDANNIFVGFTEPIAVKAELLKLEFTPDMFRDMGGKYTNNDLRTILLNAFGEYATKFKVEFHAGSEQFKRILPMALQMIHGWSNGLYSGLAREYYEGTLSKNKLDYLEALSHALEACPVKFSGEIARGMSGTTGIMKAFIERHIAAFDTGDIIHERVPASYKRGKSGAWGNDVVLHIKKSTKGVYVNPISAHHGAGEDEVLMPGFKYRVVKYTGKKGKYEFWLEEA